MEYKKNKKKNNIKNNDNKIELSIGLIVKNEERCLEKCLKALQPLKDAISCEIVIADTGSTDRTKEIASKYADVLFDFEWINDFSAARNAVMDRCSGRWYFSIDADEYLDEDSVKEIESFLKSQKSYNVDYAFITIHNYQYINNYENYSTFYVTRMVRMGTNVRYCGLVHESFDFSKLKTEYKFKDVKLWHDGYLITEDYKKKDKLNRNMKLIEKEIQKNPQNIVRYLQAIESSRTKEEQIKYTYMAMDLLKKGIKGNDLIEVAVYRYAIHFAFSYHLPEFKEWLEYVLERYPKSIYTQVEVRYTQIYAADASLDYEKVIEYGSQYIEITSKPYPQQMLDDLIVSTLNFDGQKNIENIYMLMAKAYIHLKQYDNAKEILNKTYPCNTTLSTVKTWTNLVYLLWDKIDLSDIFHNIYNDFYKLDEDNLPEELKDKKSVFEIITKKQFSYEPSENIIDDIMPKIPAYELIAELGDSELSYAAKIMLSENENEIIYLAQSIESWIKLPKNVFDKVMKLKLSLPEKFYDESIDSIQHIAGQYVADLDEEAAVDTILDWLNAVNIQSYPKDIIWRYDLIIAAVRVADWESEDIHYRNQLLDIYLKHTEQFINWYYNSEILCEEIIEVLPSMHAFAWFITKYNQEKLNNNLQQCIYWLKKALKIAPVMKDMIKYLLDSIENEIKKQEIPNEIAPEMLMLAEKVKMILGAYKEDDPAVLAIKQSDVYKKVAYLIEK